MEVVRVGVLLWGRDCCIILLVKASVSSDMHDRVVAIIIHAVNANVFIMIDVCFGGNKYDIY